MTIETGQLVIKERADDPSFTLDGVTCDGTTTVNTNLAERSITLDVKPDEDIQCAFRNVRVASTLLLRKRVQGGNGTFTFDGAGATSFRGVAITTQNGTGVAIRCLTKFCLNA